MTPLYLRCKKHLVSYFNFFSFEKPVVSTGYTPLSAVEQAKPTIPIQIDEMKTKPSIITSNEIQGISGKLKSFVLIFIELILINYT